MRQTVYRKQGASAEHLNYVCLTSAKLKCREKIGYESSNTLGKTSGLNKYKISLCISHFESLCGRDYSPDHLDQKFGLATILFPCSQTRWLRCLAKDQKVVSSNPNWTKLSGVISELTKCIFR